MGPKLISNTFRLNTELCPPSHFVTGLMHVAMMGTTERHRELIADLEAEAPRLREAQVVGIRRLAATNDAGLRCNKLAMAFVASPPRLWRHGIIVQYK